MHAKTRAHRHRDLPEEISGTTLRRDEIEFAPGGNRTRDYTCRIQTGNVVSLETLPRIVASFDLQGTKDETNIQSGISPRSFYVAFVPEARGTKGTSSIVAYIYK